MTQPAAWTRHHFAFAPAYRATALLFAITPSNSWVEVGPGGLRVRYGLWRLSTTLENITGTQRTGGFAFLKTAGPPHLSFADRGVSFTPNAREALCVQFAEPVPGIDPTRRITHPAATLGVVDPEALELEIADLLRA